MGSKSYERPLSTPAYYKVEPWHLYLTLFVVHSKLKMVTSHFLMGDSSQLLLGTDGGNVHVFDIEAFTLTDKVFYQDLILQK